MAKPKRFRVRFHLAQGPNFMRWQVSDRTDNPRANNGKAHKDYYNPEFCDIVMTGCKLGNRPATARRIFDGENKTVCAWVDCDMVDIKYKKSPDYQTPDTSDLINYKYNPRKNPHWFTDDDNNVDGATFNTLTTNGRKIYGGPAQKETPEAD